MYVYDFMNMNFKKLAKTQLAVLRKQIHIKYLIYVVKILIN